MFKKFARFLDLLFGGRTRYVLSLYLSLVLHSVFLVYFFNSGQDWENKIMVCGPPWLYEEEAEEDGALELSFSMGDKPGEGEGDIDGLGLEGEGNDGFEENPNFDKEKFGDGPWKELVERLEESSELRKNFQNNFDNITKDGTVRDSYIFRKRDYEDITLKEVFPTIHNIDKPFKDEIQSAPEDLIVHNERNRIIDMYRNQTEDEDLFVIERESEGEKVSKSPLEMSREERMEYLDKKLPLKKEAQMKDFLSRYMNYDPDKGDLPEFIRDLYYENLQRLAYSFSTDPTYFTIDYFQENLNKEDFLKNSLALYSEFQDKKLGTEILFTVENIYEIQGRALGLYFQNLSAFPSLSEESKKELRVEVIRRVLERYKPILKEKNIRTPQEVNELYLKKRLDIMDTLIANTPDNYREADALFEKGRILWEYGQYLSLPDKQEYQKKALQVWNTMNPQQSTGDFLNSKPYIELKEIIPGKLSSIDALDEAKINGILRNRLNEPLLKKRLREEKLLWKKTSDNPVTK